MEITDVFSNYINYLILIQKQEFNQNFSIIFIKIFIFNLFFSLYFMFIV